MKSRASAVERPLLSAASNAWFACSMIRCERSSPQPHVTGPDTSCTSTRMLSTASPKGNQCPSNWCLWRIGLEKLARASALVC